MGLFYDAQPASPASDEVGVRIAGRPAKLPDPKWGRVVGGLLIVIALFVLALVLENTGQHEETSKAVLHVFEVTFTALLALLGIETAKATS